MKKIIVFSFVFLSSLIFSQGRFVYELKFKIDSTNRNNIQDEVFNLDINKGESFFYSDKYAQYDSISIKNKKLGIKTPRPEPKLDYQIIKHLKDNTMFFKELVGADFFEVKDTSTQNWVLNDETKTISNFTVQKATAEYKGRLWTAWFTKDIPISDGPYKFKGLPGLILEVYDSKDDYHFTLIQIKKNFKSFNSDYMKTLGFREFRVDYSNYLKVKKQIDENPALSITQMPGMDKVVLEKSFIDEFVNAYNLRKKTRNNTIELK